MVSTQITGTTRSNLGSTVLVWIAIIFVCPVAALAFYLLLPNAFELLARILYYPKLPRWPLTFMLLTQVALIVLPLKTFASWRRNRREGAFQTNSLAGMTLAVGLFAYLWIALMLAAFPN